MPTILIDIKSSYLNFATGAPDEINPLFDFRIIDIDHHPRASSWPLRILLEDRVLSGLVPGRRRNRIINSDILEIMGIARRIIHSSFYLFISSSAVVISGMVILGRMLNEIRFVDIRLPHGETRHTRCSVVEIIRRSGAVYLDSWSVWQALCILAIRNGEPWKNGGEFLEGLLRGSFRRFGPNYGRYFGKRMMRSSCLVSNRRKRGIGSGIIAYNGD